MYRDLLTARENFNPLSPHGERRNTVKIIRGCRWISIHSPRMGRDMILGADGLPMGDFNPLSPHGERRMPVLEECFARVFQSTLPAWGETRQRQAAGVGRGISIHSPRMGRDSHE